MSTEAIITHVEYVARFPFKHLLHGSDGDLEVCIGEFQHAVWAWCQDAGATPEPEEMPSLGSGWTSMEGGCWGILRVGFTLVQSGHSGAWELLEALLAYRKQARSVLAAVPYLDPDAPLQ